MHLTLDPASPLPLYQQIRDQIRQLIASGTLARGDRLPPSRDLARRLGVHRTTVANAYAELTADGWISGHVGRGTFVSKGVEAAVPAAASPAGNDSTLVANGFLWTTLLAETHVDDPLDVLLTEALVDDPELISFTTARPAEELFLVEEFRRCCSDVLKSEGRRLLQLGPSDGYPPLKEFLREELRREGIAAGARELLVVNGCQQGLDLIRKVFVRPGDTVLLENPCYPGAIQVFRTANVRCIGVPVSERGLNLGALETLLARNRARLLLLTPNFHNPTGTTLSLDARRRVLELASQYHVPVVEDNIYGALRLRGRDIPSLKALDRAGLVLHVNSFSKVCFPGLRVGWIVASEPVIERLRIAKQATDLHTDQLAQAALAEFCRRGFLRRAITRTRAEYRARLEQAEKALAQHFPPEVHWVHPDGGMLIWVRLPEGLDAGALLLKARERKVLFTPGRFFYFQAVESHTLRLGFSSLNPQQIERGIAILGSLLKAQIRQQRRLVPRPAEPGRVALV